MVAAEFVINAGMRNGQRDKLREMVEHTILKTIQHTFFADAGDGCKLLLDEMSMRIHEDPLFELPSDGLARIEVSPNKRLSFRKWQYYYQIFPASCDKNRVPIAEGLVTATLS